MLGALEPVAQRGEESLLKHARRGVQVGRQRRDRPLVGRQEESFLTAEVLEHGTLRDTQLGRQIPYTRGMIAMLREVAHGRDGDAGTLRGGTFRNGTGARGAGSGR